MKKFLIWTLVLALLLATSQTRNPACKTIKRLMISRRRNKE